MAGPLAARRAHRIQRDATSTPAIARYEGEKELDAAPVVEVVEEVVVCDVALAMSESERTMVRSTATPHGNPVLSRVKTTNPP